MLVQHVQDCHICRAEQLLPDAQNDCRVLEVIGSLIALRLRMTIILALCVWRLPWPTHHDSKQRHLDEIGSLKHKQVGLLRSTDSVPETAADGKGVVLGARPVAQTC